MADLVARIAERGASHGGPLEESVLIRSRLRDGTLVRARVEIAAACDHAASRLALDWPAPSSVRCFGKHTGHSVRCDDCDMGAFLHRVQKLAEPLPAVQGKGERACGCCNGRRVDDLLGPCPRCSGTGRVPYVVPAPHYVLARAAWLAGEVAASAWCDEHCKGLAHSCDSCDHAGDALAAAHTWLACPCEEHERAWAAAAEEHGGGPGGVWSLPAPWHDIGGLSLVCGHGAASLAGEPPVRRAVQAGLVRWALHGEVPSDEPQ